MIWWRIEKKTFCTNHTLSWIKVSPHTFVTPYRSLVAGQLLDSPKLSKFRRHNFPCNIANSARGIHRREDRKKDEKSCIFWPLRFAFFIRFYFYSVSTAEQFKTHTSLQRNTIHKTEESKSISSLLLPFANQNIQTSFGPRPRAASSSSFFLHFFLSSNVLRFPPLSTPSNNRWVVVLLLLLLLLRGIYTRAQNAVAPESARRRRDIECKEGKKERKKSRSEEIFKYWEREYCGEGSNREMMKREYSLIPENLSRWERETEKDVKKMMLGGHTVRLESLTLISLFVERRLLYLTTNIWELLGNIIQFNSLQFRSFIRFFFSLFGKQKSEPPKHMLNWFLVSFHSLSGRWEKFWVWLDVTMSHRCARGVIQQVKLLRWSHPLTTRAVVTSHEKKNLHKLKQKLPICAAARLAEEHKKSSFIIYEIFLRTTYFPF